MKKDKIIKEIIAVTFPMVTNMTKAELIDAIASGSKLTKADAGRLAQKIIVDKLIQFDLVVMKTKLIDVIAVSAKLTKADAGRALDATIESIHKALNKKLKTVFGGRGQ